MEYIIEMLNMRKEFSGIVANDDLTLQVKPGEIHALLGENGAGKSTLMSILFGLYQPDRGTITVRGREVKVNNPNVANALGIGMVHQHFKLVHNFTVTENIILGMEPVKGGRIDIRTSAQRIAEISKQYHLSVVPEAIIEDISVGMQQRVEILKMLYRDAEILIFDEPTAVLTPHETLELMGIMKKMTAVGKTIVLITHKLKEIKAVADRCTIIRKGKTVATLDVASTTEEKMAELMVGRKVNFKLEKKPANPGGEVLRIEDLNVKDQRGVNLLKNINLSVRSGEIMGVAGVDGNGQSQLIEAITGLRKITSGRMLLKDKDISNLTVRQRNETGVGHVPEDRHKRGLVLDFTLKDNLILETYYREPFSFFGILQKDAIDSHAEVLIREFDVRSGQGGQTLARSMSGGNQQKAIIAREVDRSPELLVVAQPTRGLDVGAVEYIHKRLLEERDKGRTILMFSLELDEILNMSDRIAVMYEGEIVGIVNASETDENQLGLMMAGAGERSLHG
ncbi:MAG: ABC transporter ATP-binding protein [Clostridia bacterium]|nr:ABC transporter ATP-binding protein [Clostridia bacterium]